MTETPLLHHEDFQGLVGSTFTATIGSLLNHTTAGNDTQVFNSKVELELFETKFHDYPGMEGFSLIFITDQENLFDQGVRDIEHETLGKIQLFLTPIFFHSKRSGMYYQAVFNRIMEDVDESRL